VTIARQVRAGDLMMSNGRPLAHIAGPCALESRSHALETSHAPVEITAKLGLGFIYKTSFDKANRTSLTSDRGIGVHEGCRSWPRSMRHGVAPS
jgi:2-dehydro-3-deoxyphosphooctonate aldolase (KDO 8-P synthase)